MMRDMTPMQRTIMSLERREMHANSENVGEEQAGRVYFDYLVGILDFALKLVEKPEDVQFLRNQMRDGKEDVSLVLKLLSGDEVVVPDDEAPPEKPKPAKKTAAPGRVQR